MNICSTCSRAAILDLRISLYSRSTVRASGLSRACVHADRASGCSAQPTWRPTSGRRRTSTICVARATSISELICCRLRLPVARGWCAMPRVCSSRIQRTWCRSRRARTSGTCVCTSSNVRCLLCCALLTSLIAVWWIRADIHKLGKRMRLRQRILSTACVFFKRFYLKSVLAFALSLMPPDVMLVSVHRRTNFCEFDPRLVAPTMLFMAAKVGIFRPLPMVLLMSCVALITCRLRSAATMPSTASAF